MSVIINGLHVVLALALVWTAFWLWYGQRRRRQATLSEGDAQLRLCERRGRIGTKEAA